MEIGIDLGTTHSAIAVVRNGQPELIPNVLGHWLTPSVVGVDDNGELLVGQTARERLISHPNLTVHAFKRLMGSDREWVLGAHRFRAEELSALVLAALKADAEAFLGTVVTQAVISVPAYFNEAQRSATAHAAQLAGLEVTRLINEPTAAALVYGLHDRQDDHRYLILDLGGGTFDVTLLEFFDGVFEVHASAGDNQLGGEDFTLAIRDWLRAACKTKGTKPQADARLYQLAEQAKRALTQEQSVSLTVTPELTLTLTRDDFDGLVEPLLLRLREPIMSGLQDAGLTPAAFDDVVLVGGATRMPAVQKFIGRLFRRIPRQTLDPDTVVALGAATQASMLARNQALEDIVMTDVMPYSMGIAVHNAHQITDKLFEPIIERNQTVPVSRVKTFFPVHEDQQEILVQVYQGESRYVRNNLFLGDLRIPLPERGQQRSIDIRFTYDTSGLLEVIVISGTAREPVHSERLIIEQRPGRMSPEDIETALARLATLKIHPRDNQINRVLLARAERLYEQSLGESRAALSKQMDHFQQVLSSQQDDMITQGREAFQRWLDEFETRRWQ